MPPLVTMPPIKAPAAAPSSPPTAARFAGSGKFVHPVRLYTSNKVRALGAMREVTIARPAAAALLHVDAGEPQLDLGASVRAGSVISKTARGRECA
jgi:hypothetical protein